MFLVAPIIGRLMTIIDMRLMIAFGLIVFAIGSYQMTWITKDYDFYELLAAADPARHRHDVRDGADQHHCARHAAAGAVEKRLRPCST